MPENQPRKRPPKYCEHKATGRAYVTVGGKRIYLGKHGSLESQREYQKILAQLHADADAQGVRRKRGTADLTIGEILAAFQAHALSHYRRADGTLTSEIGSFAAVSRLLREQRANSHASEFGPLALKAVRERMIEAGWSRKHINKQVNRIRHIFRWAAENELIPESAYTALQTVSPLKRGRSTARETAKVLPVPAAHIDPIRPHVSRQVWAIVQLQLLTGARAGELVGIRAVDIDTKGRVWLYAPPQHKTAHLDHERFIYFGPRAQAVLRPFMANRPVDAYLFSPREAEDERRAQRHERRQTPLSCGNRPGSNRRRKPRREPGEVYNTTSYRRAIQRACDRAGIPRWHPHQLRHNAATEHRLRRVEHGHLGGGNPRSPLSAAHPE